LIFVVVVALFGLLLLLARKEREKSEKKKWWWGKCSHAEAGEMTILLTSPTPLRTTQRGQGRMAAVARAIDALLWRLAQVLAERRVVYASRSCGAFPTRVHTDRVINPRRPRQADLRVVRGRSQLVTETGLVLTVVSGRAILARFQTLALVVVIVAVRWAVGWSK